MFERDVRPILKAHCFQCHGEAGHREGNLDLRLRRLMAEGGDTGPAIEPGKPDESYLVERIRTREMPPGKETPKLSVDQIATIERWVAQGAPTARPEPTDPDELPLFTDEEREHWAFRKISRPAVAKPQAWGRVRNEIDAFLLARLEKAGLTFSPDADRRTLIRRATFDLHGLPPSPEEVAVFVNDPAADAYERLIDRLLDSPRYGERWGRHWLDVAGYADSEGYHEDDTPRENAWRYRDYVIRSFNADKPFDVFIQEQLAGDELVAEASRRVNPGGLGESAGGEKSARERAGEDGGGEPRRSQGTLAGDALDKLTATGFLRMAPDGTGSKNDDQDLARNAVLTETVKIVSTTFLGLTVGCAECHDHRFDPILQKDFYRLRALFEPGMNWKAWKTPRQRRLSLATAAQRAEADRLEAEARAVEAELSTKLAEYQAWVFEREVEQIPEEFREQARAAGLRWQRDPEHLSPEQKQVLENYPSLQVAATPQRLNLFLGKYGRADELARDVKENAARARAIRDQQPPEEFLRIFTEPGGEPPVTHLFRRGMYSDPAESVPPGDLTVLGPQPVDFPVNDPDLATTGRRLAFARRLTDGTHPLAPRVLVNRFWMQHFGKGIVGSPGDFGTQGERPTHPELLDWLASEFVVGGWRLKPLHRLIMSSTAYRQSSVRNESVMRVDFDNQLYWRMPVRRLEAEAIRDAVLAVSGRSNAMMYGPPVPVVADANNQLVVGDGKVSEDRREFGRSVYVEMRRTRPPYVLQVFDAPQMEPNCEARTVSTVATQSLLMMNSQFIADEAQELARRVWATAGSDRTEQVRAAWRAACGTEPPPADFADAAEYLETQSALLQATLPEKMVAEAGHLALASLCQLLFASNRFLYVE